MLPFHRKLWLALRMSYQCWRRAWNLWRTPMPVRESGGGYKYGSKGKRYTGPGARAKAERQDRAIRASQARQGRKAK